MKFPLPARPSKAPPMMPKPPAGEFVKVVRDPSSGWQIVTVYTGCIVGPRLNRGCGVYPPCETSRLTFAQALEAFALWEKFCSVNQPKKKGKR